MAPGIAPLALPPTKPAPNGSSGPQPDAKFVSIQLGAEQNEAGKPVNRLSNAPPDACIPTRFTTTHLTAALNLTRYI